MINHALENSSNIRDDFPILENLDCVYLDSGATSLKPETVAASIASVYRNHCSNVGRSSHFIANDISAMFEDVRVKFSSLINSFPDEIVFTQNCTDSINTVANTLDIKESDRVIISELEHHSNLLPWKNKGDVDIVKVGPDGTVDLEHLEQLLKKDTKLVSITYVSNVTGNIQPIEQICSLARKYGALTMVDAAQAIGHIPVDVHNLDCDFLACSAHKMLGPTGVGMLYIKRQSQKHLGLSRVGGGMVRSISDNGVLYHSGFKRFEAGTPNIEGVIGLGAAIDYISEIGVERIHEINMNLSQYFLQKFERFEKLYFPFPLSKDRIPLFTFCIRGNSDINFVSNILSSNYKIAISSGYQCNQPIYNKENLSGGLRASMHFYNNFNDIDRFFNALEEINPIL